MPVPVTPQDSRTVIVVVIIIAALCVIYWKMAIRIALILMLALAVYGAIRM